MVEKAAYDVIKKIDNVEIRNYPELILASVKGVKDDEAFGLLFNYISGYNKSQKKISMTAPVITSEKIPMTAPVLSKKDYMAFIMPSSFDESTIPNPKDENVKIEIQPKKKVAVLRFSGYTSDKKTYKRISELLSILKKHQLKTKGEPFLMRYNSPFAPGFIRRNEVAIEII
jgi:effector-binding domain-containing protein